MKTFDVVAVNRSSRTVLTADGECLPVSTFLDEDGDETDDPAAAVAAFGPLPDGRWFTVDLRQFDRVRMH